MTHYRVAVIQTPDAPGVERLMARYDENISVEPYVDVTREDAIAHAREQIADAEKAIAEGRGNEYFAALVAHADDDDETLLAWYAEDWCEQEQDDEGNLLTTYNPDAKWDYYGEIDRMTFAEWLASGSNKTDDELRSEWRRLSTEGDGFWNAGYYTKCYGNEDTFIAVCKLPSAWAVVTPDGKWHEPGTMGWFACHDATAAKRAAWAANFQESFITPYKDVENTRVVMLDCHI